MKELWISNTGAKMDLTSLEAARNSERSDALQVVYVLQETVSRGRYRVATSGVPLADTQPGSKRAVYSQKSGHYLGSWVVVGVWHLGPNEVYGKIPQRTLAHYVCK